MRVKYNYSVVDWNRAKQEIKNALIEQAKRKSTIAYSDLVKMLQTITLDQRSPALAEILGEISSEEDASGRGMLSAVVVHKQGDMAPGPGFYELAKSLGCDVSDKDACWIKELNFVFDYWSHT